jgi:glycerophosphoryl diester phosphodiesterase
MQILSHRGFHLGAAGIHENTHAAFERAIRSGADGIETDIRLSADAQQILFHDRLAPDDRPVEMLTRGELAKIVGYEIPTVIEALAQFPNTFWNLEIKCAAAVPATIDAVRRHSRPEALLLTSFRHDIVRECAETLDVACGLIAAHAPIDVPQMLGAWQKCPKVRTVVWDFNVLTADLVQQAQDCGFKVYVYGTVTPAEHASCRKWGIDGVITDFPDRAEDRLGDFGSPVITS